jgi:hypothetical protein
VLFRSAPIKPYGTKSLSSGNVKVYFNASVNNDYAVGQNAIQLFEALDDTLIAYIDRAEQSLDVTIYDFDNTNISNISTAIKAAQERGVKVRFISDGSLEATNFAVSELLPTVPKILSPTGTGYTIMHNKFVVIDANHSNPNKPIVWTGATNWTDRQINRDPNNVIIVQDQTLARNYKLEFDEMWGDTGVVANLTNSRFGQYKTDNTPHEFIINGKRVQSSGLTRPTFGENIHTVFIHQKGLAIKIMIIGCIIKIQLICIMKRNGIYHIQCKIIGGAFRNPVQLQIRPIAAVVAKISYKKVILILLYFFPIKIA